MSKQHTIKKMARDIILTPIQNQESSLVFMHGLGDSAEGWYETFLYENLNLENTKIILLTAPVGSVSLNGGMNMNSWFDIYPSVGVSESYSYEDVKKSSELVQKTIDQEIEFYKGDSSKVYIGGFSQGAAMSLQIGLENATRLGGIIALSGFLFKETQIKQPETNMLIVHGIIDEMIELKKADLSYTRIKNLQNFSFYPIENLGHSINGKILHLIAKFFKK